MAFLGAPEMILRAFHFSHDWFVQYHAQKLLLPTSLPTIYIIFVLRTRVRLCTYLVCAPPLNTREGKNKEDKLCAIPDIIDILGKNIQSNALSRYPTLLLCRSEDDIGARDTEISKRDRWHR